MTAPEPDSVATKLPPLVRSRVTLVRRGLISVRWAQSLCLGVAATVLGLAAGVAGGAPLFSTGLLCVALVHGLTVLFLWLHVHRRSSAQVARDVDRAMDCGGELFTAWEVEHRSHPTELARRLGQRAAAGATPHKMLRASLPPSLPLLVAPFAAMTLLIGVLERQRSTPIDQDLAGLASLVEQGLAGISARDQGTAGAGGAALSPVESRDLQNLMREAAALGESIAAADADHEQLAEMAERLAEMETRLGPRAGQDLKAGLHRTQTALDAARMALEGHAGGAGTFSGGELGDEAASSSGSGLASGSGDGKPPDPNSLPTSASHSSEAGVLGLPSWPSAYDGIVERWVESARRSSPR